MFLKSDRNDFLEKTYLFIITTNIELKMKTKICKFHANGTQLLFQAIR